LKYSPALRGFFVFNYEQMNLEDKNIIEQFLSLLVEMKSKITIWQASNQYRENFLPVKSESYKRSCEGTFKSFSKFLGRDLPLHLITKAIAQKFIFEIFARGKEYQSLLHFRILKAFFNWCIDLELCSKNPFHFKAPKPRMNLPAYLTENDFNFLLGFITEPLLRDFYSVLFFTGLRAGEGCNLQFSDLNFQQRAITIQNKENFSTKSRRERIVPMNQIVYEILKNRVPKIYSLNKNHYVFWLKFPSVSLSVDYVSKKFKKAIRKGGLNPKLHLHSLRHSFCSNLVNAGVNLSTIGALAGHHSTKVTEIYSHVSNSSLFQAVELLNRADSVCAGGSFGS